MKQPQQKGNQSMKWEYTFCPVDELPMMGEAGWEAYAVVQQGAQFLQLTAYVKRQAPMGNAEPEPLSPAFTVWQVKTQIQIEEVIGGAHRANTTVLMLRDLLRRMEREPR